MSDIFRIIKFSGRLWRYYAAIAVFVVIISALNLVNPFLLKAVVDILVAHIGHPNFPFNSLIVLVSLMLVSSLASTLLSNWNGYIGDILSVKLTSLLSERYYQHLLKLPVEYFDNQITGKLTSRLERSITTISQLIQVLSNNFLQAILTLVFTLAAIAFYSWPVAIFLALLFPVYIWITQLSSRAWIKKQEGINKDTDYSQGRFIEAVTQVRVVKSFAREQEEGDIYSGRRRSIERQTVRQSRQWHWYDVARRAALNFIFFLIYAYIVWQTLRGRLSLGGMVLLVQLTTQAQMPLFGSSFIIDSIQRAQAGSRDYFEVMSVDPWITDKSSAKEIEISRAEVRFKDVKFAYKNGQAVLNGISFTIEPGTKLALVGESGQGKTTISNLLLRFYEPSSGEITIDGVDIREVKQESLRRAIGVVFQEPALFSGTVKENISYGVPEAGQEAIEAAAKAANAHDFISKLPKGYDTEIGERGIKLSGGQKQRIAIARAVLKNPPILILDEATSSLDSKAEREVQDALEKLMQNRTTLIIAHRLSTIAEVDRIVVLSDGKVAETGSPVELAEAGGIYAELLKLQSPSKSNREKLKKFDIAKV